jgi:hypothetical protein
MFRNFMKSFALIILIAALTLPLIPHPSATAQSTTLIWANNGEDKVTQDERRATQDPSSVQNSVWDGETVHIFGARNEVVAFNLIIESPDQATSNLSVSFDQLTGPDGANISSTPTDADG